MAFGRLERNPGAQPMSDINMTPLIDVMLVLLVIFMITAPLMTSSLKLDLPKTGAAQPNDAPQSIAVALDKDGRTFFGDEALVMTAAGLAVAIPAVLAYNVFGKRVAASEAELEGFAHDLREMIIDGGLAREPEPVR